MAGAYVLVGTSVPSIVTDAADEGHHNTVLPVLRDICSWHLINHDAPPDVGWRVVVQIDELLFKHKSVHGYTFTS